MEKIQIRCEHCSARLAVPESAIGKKLRCPKCQGIVVVAVISKAEEVIPPPKKNQKSAVRAVKSSATTNKIIAPALRTTQKSSDANNEWFFQSMAETFGPITASELLLIFEKGRIDADTPVKRLKDESWGELQDFLDVLRSPPPIPQEVIQIPVQEPRNSPTVEQLDNTLFLVEDLPIDEVFERLKNAAGQSHTLTGAFSRSGLIRGTGVSGISFVITVKQTDEGVTFLLDGETPNGPANFGALFDPTSGQGWGLLAATSLFNSAVNASAAKNIETDVRTLLMNLLSGFDAEHLLLGDVTKVPPILVTSTQQQLSNGLRATSVAGSQLTTTLPLTKVVVLIMNTLQQPPDSSPVVERVLRLISFKATFKANNIEWNGHEITAQIPPSGASQGYSVVIPVFSNANGTCGVNVTLTRLNSMNVLDFGQKKRTLAALNDAIRQAIAQTENTL